MKIQIQCRVFNTVSKWMRTCFFHLVGHHGIRISATEWFCHMSICQTHHAVDFGIDLVNTPSLNPQIVEGIPTNWRCEASLFPIVAWMDFTRYPVPSKSYWYSIRSDSSSESHGKSHQFPGFLGYHTIDSCLGTGALEGSPKKTREMLIWPSKSRGANMAICFFTHLGSKVCEAWKWPQSMFLWMLDFRDI
jgi:hypothetical protein